MKNPNADLTKLGLKNIKAAFWNLTSEELVKKSVDFGQGVLADNGALCVHTGEFTGRSPKDKFIVKDAKTENTVNWNDINLPISPENFDRLYEKVMSYLSGKEIYVRDSYACSDSNYRLNIRTISEYPWSSLFAYNMFLRPTKDEILKSDPDWLIIQAPEFKASGSSDGIRQHNFSLVNFTKKIILIGGSAYTGEIKKGIFTVLNYILPQEKNVLSMHCSANVGKQGDTALFFGLSGTGKTTLSADPDRQLIGDDEHGWTDNDVFNFEGGCYAKCVNLSKEKEPQIFTAIKPGSLLENIKFHEGTQSVNFDDISLTENTRVSYPIFYIDNIVKNSMGGVPKNIFFLTADAFGVLPPISRLNPGQAMYYFISGYTAKVAGTEAGVTEPKSTFSACFGAAFLPLHPVKYAEMLGKKMRATQAKVWLVNTGWSGGPYGVGSRMKLSLTRAMITAALNGDLDNLKYEIHPIFGLEMPMSCPNVPSEILNPRNTWSDKSAYDVKANNLAAQFNRNFEKYASQSNDEILAAAPKVTVNI